MIQDHEELVKRMHSLIDSSCQSEEVIRTKAEVLKQNLKILTKCTYDSEEERWHAPECARHYPERMVKSKLVT